MVPRFHQLLRAAALIQWHPISAALLRPLLEAYYEVHTDVPVGGRPRAADMVLRRPACGDPPCAELGRWLVQKIREERCPMPAPDQIHNAVKNALLKDGWTITDDPYLIQYEDATL